MSEMRNGIDPETPWMQTTSGRHVSLLEPTPDMIDLCDIATALERLVRFTGHGDLTPPWTIARHSITVARIVAGHGWDDQVIATALLHDATEAYIGDLSRPLKQSLRLLSGADESPLDVIEDRLWSAICSRFDLIYDMPAAVRDADGMALALEADELFGAGTGESWGLVHPPWPVGAPMASFMDVARSVELS